jgi:hypothetical protein
MHTTTAPKKKNKGIEFTAKEKADLASIGQRTNILPIALQIQFKAQAKRHDKSRTRMKQRRDWQG